MDAHQGRAELVEIDREECVQLLAAMSIGRLAIGREGTGPLVVPVNYALDGEVIVLRSDPGTKLDLLADHPVSFQVDAIDPYHRTGWSVLVTGTAHEVAEHAAGATPTPWASGPRAHWVRIEPDAITGRRVRLPDLEGLPVDRRGGYL